MSDTIKILQQYQIYFLKCKCHSPFENAPAPIATFFFFFLKFFPAINLPLVTQKFSLLHI